MVMAKRTRQGTIGAAEFKARCLELMDKVRETGRDYVITKHGVPVARLVPVTAAAARPLFGSMAGTLVTFERPFDPIDANYDIDR